MSKIFIRDYKITERIGGGSFGSIWLLESDKGEKLILKQIETERLSSKHKQNIIFETELCGQLKHKNITKCFGGEIKNNIVKIYLEYANGGDLFNHLDLNGGFLSENETKKVIKDILSALVYCHELKICHHDLKPNNILVFNEEKETVYKLADWGLADITEKSIEQRKGSLYYMAPELVKGEEHFCDKTDMWAVGIIAGRCLEGEQINTGDVDGRDQITKKIIKNKLVFKKASKEAQEFIKKLLVIDPDKRLTAKQALQEKWLN